ncbi:MAG: hypothetical protein ACRD2I_15455 [Vicinamibacterales bacterium]
MNQRLVLALAFLWCGGCVTAPRSPACNWTEESASVLDLSQAAQQRHLSTDARTAEEWAIRYADAARGHRSGHYGSADEYHGIRDGCLASLLGEIALRHQGPPSENRIHEI